MTPFQSEIAHIIAGFSWRERALFAAMGGRLPNVSAPDPQWWRPGVDKLNGFQRQQHESACTIRVKLDNGPAVTIREAAGFLGVTEAHLRNRMRGDEGVVRGVKVTRLSPRRRRYGDVKEGKAA